MLRRLAGGGMGEVYLAAANGPAGFVKHAVVKRILPHFATDPEFVAMFVNEARLAAALDHPNIVRVYDFGEVHGNFFYAMEYLHGDSLAALLPIVARARQRLPLEHALTIGLGLSAGLHFAHEWRGPEGPREIVHRDVSPANVFVTVEGEVKLLDFGIAKVLSTTKVTRDGTRKGKVPYMSPEQCIGQELDRRSDVYSLGILLYEMTTMTRLYRGDNEFATMNMITSGEVPPPASRVPDYPGVLAEVVLRALSRDRDRRYASALELHEALEQVAGELGLRTSALALGRWVRKLIDDRPFPSIEAPQQADEPQTVVFFQALNEALTVREDIGAASLPRVEAVAAAPAQSQEPGVAVLAADSPTRLTAVAPSSHDSQVSSVVLVDVDSPAPRSRAPLVASLAGAGALLLAVAWWGLGGAPPVAASTVEAPTPTIAPIAAPPVVNTPAPETPAIEPPAPAPAVVGEVQADTAAGPTVAPTAGKPASKPRSTASKTPRKKTAKKANVLDSLRPSK